MGCFYDASDAIDLVTAAKYAAFWVIEDRVFVKQFVDCSAATRRVILAKHVGQITKQ